MIATFFHRWEQRLAEVSRHERVVRPFEWGLDWMAHHSGPFTSRNGAAPAGSSLDQPEAHIRNWVSDVMRDTDTFFTPVPSVFIV